MMGHDHVLSRDHVPLQICCRPFVAPHFVFRGPKSSTQRTCIVLCRMRRRTNAPRIKKITTCLYLSFFIIHYYYPKREWAGDTIHKYSWHVIAVICSSMGSHELQSHHMTTDGWLLSTSCLSLPNDEHSWLANWWLYMHRWLLMMRYKVLAEISSTSICPGGCWYFGARSCPSNFQGASMKSSP